MNQKNQIDQRNQTNPMNSFLVSNTPPTTLFLGVSLSNIIETFNIFSLISSKNQTNQTDQINQTNQTNQTNQNILFDFESESDLKRLNWECHKWFERSEVNATSGKYSLKVSLSAGNYPGVDFQEIQNDWSKSRYFKMDIFNPFKEIFRFHVRIDDNKSGWEYADRFDIDFKLKPGMNYISIPTDSIRTNIHHRPLNLKKIKRMMVFIPGNLKKREIFLDNIRLE
jgi:hypothetical protein